MLGLLVTSILRQPGRSLLLLFGFLVLNTGILLLAGASQTTAILVDQDLTRFWRTTYDILVRPPDSRLPVEEEYGLVEANHLSGIAGGITAAQYEAIKAIPGVEVAAPIAMLGYVMEQAPLDNFSRPPDGAYVLEVALSSDDGMKTVNRSYSKSYYYIGSEAGSGAVQRINPNPHQLSGEIMIPLLIAGIDPSQEAALVGLEQALKEGEYLKNEESIQKVSTTDWFGDPMTNVTIPILINATPYIRLDLRAELRQFLLPPEVSTLQDILANGGWEYLESLPVEEIAAQQLDSETLYQRLVGNLMIGTKPVPGPTGYPDRGTIHGIAYSIPSRIHYREISHSFPFENPVLEIILPQQDVTSQARREPAYRLSPDPWLSDETRFDAYFIMEGKGIFDVEGIPPPGDVNRVPLETYFPPLATLRYDLDGHPVEPLSLYPTLNPNGYIQSPPLILTTLEAAKIIAGEECISAIRVRVEGIDDLTPAAQRKIEAVASEIYRTTGLTVDVMVGSSPRRVLVRVPEVGYVEENWIQKGVHISYQQRVQSGHFLLLAALVAIGGLYTLDLAWADMMTRYRTIALQKALGWRSTTVFAQLLWQALLLGLTGAVSGALMAWVIMAIIGWEPPSSRLLVGLPVITVFLSLAGSLFPAWLATRIPPILHIQRIGLKPYSRIHRQLRWLGRRPGRAILGGLAAGLAAALLIVLLGVSFQLEGYLASTLLGEYILVRIEGHHYAIVVVGLLLAALTLSNSLLAGVLERRWEIGLLKAVGWRTGIVARVFVMEGMLLGLLGGVVGALLGGAGFFGLYGNLTASFFWIAAVGVTVPCLVGAIAAIYPAMVAARVPPAEAARFEY